MTKLFVSCCCLGPGGAERVLSILSEAFADEYDEVVYVMWKDLPIFYEIDKRVKLVSIEKEIGSSNLLKQMLWFRRFVRANNPSLILSFLAPFNMCVLASLLFSNQRIVVAERNDPEKSINGKLLSSVRNLLYHKAIGILTQTYSGKEYFSHKLQNKIRVIYNPILMDQSHVAAWDVDKTEKVILSAARLEPQKNQKMLISAFAQFHKTHSDYKLIVLGEGSERQDLERLIVELNLEDAVSLPGVSAAWWEQAKRSQMFVLSSNYEGMSNSLIEAMCMGVPCISTKVCGSVDLIQDGKNGYLVDIGDTDAFCTCMNTLAFDKELSMSFSRISAKLYEGLNSKAISAQWVSYLSEMISAQLIR